MYFSLQRNLNCNGRIARFYLKIERSTLNIFSWTVAPTQRNTLNILRKPKLRSPARACYLTPQMLSTTSPKQDICYLLLTNFTYYLQK